MKTYYKYLYPKIEPYEIGYIDTKEKHKIYYEVSGNKNGVPIVYVHGGPGGGTSNDCRRYFDPKYYKIILFDQRGCGKSKPQMLLQNNTTMKLIEDMEALRKKLNINKWILFGGSWGTTLSLIYAINYPNNVLTMVLRGIFLARKSDSYWLYQEGASYLRPLEYQKFVSLLNEKQRKNIIKSYHELINGQDYELAKKAMIAWARWESCLVSTNKFKFSATKNLESNLEIAKIENHFFVNNFFIEENYIINNSYIIENIPTYIVHGNYDLDCRPSGAFDLSQVLKNCNFNLIHGTAHTQREYKITKALIEITDQLKSKF